MGSARQAGTGPNTSGVVVLTGAANGIGRATALALAARGFGLGLIDRDQRAIGEGAAVAGKAPGHAVPGDVRDAARSRSDRGIEENVGPTDVLVPCAGVGGLSSATDLDLENFGLMLEINVLGVARTIEAVLPGMYARVRPYRRDLECRGHRGMPWMPGYSASKAALTTYLEALRPALKRRGVTITTVYPGFVKTAMTVHTRSATPSRCSSRRKRPSTSSRRSSVDRATTRFPSRPVWHGSPSTPAESAVRQAHGLRWSPRLHDRI